MNKGGCFKCITDILPDSYFMTCYIHTGKLILHKLALLYGTIQYRITIVWFY